VVENGASKLSTGLAKIVNATKKQNSSQRGFQRRGQQQQNINAFKALFITDPDKASTDRAAIRDMDASGMVDPLEKSILLRQVEGSSVDSSKRN